MNKENDNDLEKKNFILLAEQMDFVKFQIFFDFGEK